MNKFIATLAALITLVVQITALSEMAGREHPPPFLQMVIEIPANVADFLHKIDYNELATMSKEYFGKGVYAFNETTKHAWKLWGIITLIVSIPVFLGTWIYKTVSWGLLDIEETIESIGVSFVVIVLLLILKVLWLLIRYIQELYQKFNKIVQTAQAEIVQTVQKFITDDPIIFVVLIIVLIGSIASFYFWNKANK